MRYCVQCGHNLEDESRFCNSCGAASDPRAQREIASGKAGYCSGCGALFPEGRTRCPLCGSRAGRTPDKPPPRSISLSDTLLLKLPAVFRRRQERPTSVLAERNVLTSRAFLVILVLSLGIAAIAFWQYLPRILPGDAYPLHNAVLYVGEGGRLILKGVDAEPYVIAEEFASSSPSDTARASPDGRYLAYTDSSGGLYFLDLTALNKAELQPQEGVLVDQDVTASFDFSRKGTALVYLKTDGTLAVWQGDAKYQLDTDAAEIIDVGERQVLYSKAAGDTERFSLYLRSLDPAADDKLLIAGVVGELLDFTKNYSAFLYSQPRHEPLSGSYSHEVSLYDSKTAQTHTLASGVTQVLDASAERRIVVFAKEQPFTLRYDDILDDPMAADDDTLKEPDPMDFGLPENYTEIYEEEMPDTDNRQQELEQEELYYDSYMNYRRARDQYSQKLERDAIRSEIRRQVNNFSLPGDKSCDLFIYQDGASHLLQENLLFWDSFGFATPLENAVRADIKGNSVVFLRSCVTDLEKTTLEDWSKPDFNLRDHFYGALPQTLCWSALDGNVQTVFSGGDQHILSFSVSASGDKLAYLTAPKDAAGASSLSYQPLPVAETPTPVLVDVDISFLPQDGALFNGALLYGKSPNDGRFDLYSAPAGQEPVLMAADISQSPLFTVENDGKTLLFYRRFGTGSNQGYERGELYLYISQERMIIGDVYGYDYRGDRLIYLMRNLDASGRFDLQVYREGGVSPVDSGVVKVIPIRENN